MRNLHQILLQEDGVEVWHLFRLWKKLQLRASKYKNNRIFTLRCLHNDLIPVSIKLKSTLKSARANKILRKVEKELLQTRVKSINYILDNTSQQLEECRSQLVSIISAQRLRECQDFVDKVGEIRFNKVKQRQLNKFNLLTNRKEGNITRSNNTNSNTNNLNTQSGSQINQINQIIQTTSQANPPLPMKEAFLPRQVLSLPEKLVPPLPGKLVPLWQLLPLLGKQAVSPRELLLLPGVVCLRQLLSFLVKEAVPPKQLLSPTGKEAVYPGQVLLTT